MEAIETIEGEHGITAGIYYDDCAANPIEALDLLVEVEVWYPSRGGMYCSRNASENRTFDLNSKEFEMLREHYDGFSECLRVGKVKPEFFGIDQSEINVAFAESLMYGSDEHSFFSDGIYGMAKWLIANAYDIGKHSVYGYCQGDYWEYVTVVTKKRWAAMFGDKPFDNSSDYDYTRLEDLEYYLRGDVYTITVEQNGEILDSCGGFYGHECAESEARSMLEYAVKEHEKTLWQLEHCHI